MKTAVLVLCSLFVVLSYGYGGDPPQDARTKETPVLPDAVNIHYQCVDGHVHVVLNDHPVRTRVSPVDVDLQWKNGEIVVTAWMSAKKEKEENTSVAISLKKPKSLTITGVQMQVVYAGRYHFTDAFGYRYLLVSGPPMEKAPASPLRGTLEWREEHGSLVTFTEPSVGQMTVIREWMRYPKKK